MFRFNRKKVSENVEETRRVFDFARRGGDILRPFHPRNDHINCPNPPNPEPRTTTERRIAELQSLLDRGVISGQDFEKRKDAILREV